MAIMKITELTKSELILLIDNRRTIIQSFLHDNCVIDKVKEAIEEAKSILDEIDTRITA